MLADTNVSTLTPLRHFRYIDKMTFLGKCPSFHSQFLGKKNPKTPHFCILHSVNAQLCDNEYSIQTYSEVLADDWLNASDELCLCHLLSLRPGSSPSPPEQGQVVQHH